MSDETEKAAQAMAEMGDDDGSIQIDLGEMDDPDPEAEPESEMSMWDRLTNNKNSKPLSDVERAWNPEEGGPTRVKRGISNLTDVSSLAIPLYDIPVGVLETAYLVHTDNFSLKGETNSDSESESESEVGEVEREADSDEEKRILNA